MKPLALVAVLALAPAAVAQERFAERTPAQIFPQPHTMSRAGNSASVAWWATPGVGRHDAGGTVGGTFGLDHVGFGRRPGRVFLSPSADPSRGTPVANNYRTDGPHVPDVFAARPLRKAILEKREAAGERRKP